MDKILSFIVPVYNVRDYVIRCMETLVRQDLPLSDYEIIVVNDGSQDDSLMLITEFSKKYDNIQIINQDNRGLSEARNQGFKHSTGKYVWFIDSDDWITENCLSVLLKVMDTNQLDMFGVAPSLPFQTDFNAHFNENTSCSPVLSGKERLINESYVIGAWCYIYRSGFLRENNLMFMRGVYFEDEEFTPRALFYATKVMMLRSFSVYSYFMREGSITKAFSQKKIEDKLRVAKSLFDFLNENVSEYDKKLKNIFEKRIVMLSLSGLNEIKQNELGIQFLSSYLLKAKEERLYPFCMRGISLKTRVLFVFWNCFPRLCYRLKI